MKRIRIIACGFTILGVFFLVLAFFCQDMKLEVMTTLKEDFSLLQKWRDYYQNEEIVGILSIAGFAQECPVLQATDNTYYLHHNPKKEESKTGSLFLKSNCDIANDKKLIIYGSNEAHSIPASILEQYVDSYFLQEHPNLSFIGFEEQRLYQVFSVMLLENQKFYEEVVLDEEEWVKHLQKIHDFSVYDIDYEAKKEDEILLLPVDINNSKRTLVIAAVLLETEELSYSN